MRLAPVPLFYANKAQEAIERSADSSRTTHGAEEAVDASRYLGALIVGAVKGVEKKVLLSSRYSPVAGYWDMPRIRHVCVLKVILRWNYIVATA
jgi:ADP-ribosylglycohydrolase